VNQQGTSSSALPTIDQIANEHFNQGGNEDQGAPSNEQDQIVEEKEEDEKPAPTSQQWEQLTAQERNVYLEKEKLRKEREEFNNQRSERLNGIDDVVKEFMGGGDESDKNDNLPGSEGFDPVKYKEDLKKELMDEFNGHTAKEKEQQQLETQTNEFKSSIKDFLTEKSSEFPLSSGMDQSELVFNIIEQQYQKDAKDYGYDYADKNMLNSEQASAMAEKHLASEIDKVLQSEHTREYLFSAIQKIKENSIPKSVEENQLNSGNQSNQPQTLTNQMTQTTTQNQHIDETKMTEEERFNRALSAIPKG